MKIWMPGPSFCRRRLPVQDGDDEHTLAERILKEEHRIYTEAVRFVLEGNYRIEGRRVLRGKS